MTDAEKSQARGKGGRPRKEPAKGKRANYSFRMTDFTRDQIMGKANESGRSMSEEIEHRVETSLLKDGRLYSTLQLIGGQDKLLFAALMNGDLIIAIKNANEKVNSPGEWYDNPEKLDLVKQHMRDVIERSIETYARMVQTGIADRTGKHAAGLIL